MFVTYPAIFYKNKENEGYTVVFPNLEYGATEGRNETEAVQMAQDYIGSWLYEDYLENKAFPESSRIDEITVEDNEFSDIFHSFFKLIEVDFKEYLRNHNI
ncbi:type II toxin-antitoxin system HicB family antitoxin [Granulicatella sp.]